MYGRDSILAVVPARSGSQGLTNKNVLNCAGKPLIEWTISAAAQVPLLDEVLVSTDSDTIAELARRAGASVPFLRPAALATDDASLLDTVKHAWQTRKSSAGRLYDYIVVLQPTSPLRTAQHILDAINHYFRNRKTDDDTLASVYPVANKYGWLMESNESGYVDFCMNVSTKNPRRQDCKPLYLPNGAIFLTPGRSLEHGWYAGRTLPFVMSSDESIDIDSLDDLKQAERALNALQA